jgi:hypothetical protein
MEGANCYDDWLIADMYNFQDLCIALANRKFRINE